MTGEALQVDRLKFINTWGQTNSKIKTVKLAYDEVNTCLPLIFFITASLASRQMKWQHQQNKLILIEQKS